MGKKNKKRNNDKFCNNLIDYELPPCAKFLGSNNPFVKDGKIIYKNLNRLYFFLTFNTYELMNSTYNPLDSSTYNSTANGNLQIEPYYFFIGLYINAVQRGEIKYDKEEPIHEDKDADGFIKKILDNDYTVSNNFIPSLTYLISNSEAVIPFFTGNIQISPINYYIVLMLSRSYGNYGMLYSDNAFVTNDFINCTLANMYFQFN